MLSEIQAWLLETSILNVQRWWVIQCFILVFLVLVVNVMARRFLARLGEKLQGTVNPWDDAFVHALSAPLGVFIWVVGITWAIEMATLKTALSFSGILDPMRRLAVVSVLAWFVVRFIVLAERNLLHPSDAKHAPDSTTVHAISKLLRVSVLITAGLVILQTFGYSVSGVLAFGGIGGIAVGFAAKDLLANFFGAVMLYLDRPFRVGDWIRSPDREIEGTVEEVSWRLTRIRTFDARPLYVPNSVFANIAVENPSRMLNRRIYETIGVRYEDQDRLATILVEIRALLKAHSDIDQQRIIMVNLNHFGPSSLDFFIYCFTLTTDWKTFHEVKERVLFAIHDVIRQQGAEIAYPTSTVHLEALPGRESGPVRESEPVRELDMT
ncbi:MAG: mechanosensitive ion channel family protein [Gammaproteobacteria bacterium]